MKNYIKILILIILIPFYGKGQELRKVNNDVFREGEEFKFDAYYHSLITGRVSAGIVTLGIRKDLKEYMGRKTYHIEGTGKTKTFFNLFFKVVDRYESFIDIETLAPWYFVRRVYEGNYIIEQDVYFNQFKNIATLYQLKKTGSGKFTKTQQIKPYTQDIISAFYYARTADLTNIKVNDEIPIQFMLDDSVYVSKIVYQGKETIKTRLGEFRCMKFKPMVLKGEVFSQPYPMSIWISDDKNRIPLLAESEVVVGTVKLELIKYSGLANPLTSKIK